MGAKPYLVIVATAGVTAWVGLPQLSLLRHAEASDWTGLARIDSLAAAGDHAQQGVGTHLLEVTEAACSTPKLFTSTNVSNHPMQRLL